MKINLTKFEDGSTVVEVALTDFFEAVGNGKLRKQDDIITIADVPYKWSTLDVKLELADISDTAAAHEVLKVNAAGTAFELTKLPIASIDITGATASQIIKMNSGGTALEWAADA